MSVIHDPQAAPQYPQPQPYPGWTGPAGPGDPGGTGGMGDGPGGRPRQPWYRRPVLVITASLGLAAAAAGGGIAWAASGTAASTPVLTTAQITARTDPALVDVVSTLGYRQATSAGTGLVLTPDGQVLTNNHVIEGATSITVRDVGNGRTYKAVVAGYDIRNDIAVLQLQNASGLKTVTLGDSSTVKVGDKVVGIGNAGGVGGRPSAVTGKVTALGQSITATDDAAGTSEHLTGLIRTNANIKPGDSGGALVNSHGQVIGINTAGTSRYQLDSLDSGRAPTRSYAIPVNKATAIADQIEAGKASATVHIGATAFLGVAVLPSQDGLPGGVPGAVPGSASTGVTVAGVTSGSPAARAGLTGGDQIVSLGGHRVTSPSGIQNVLVGYRPGDKISITWLDQLGQTHTATVVLATGPAA